jgi:hypothetical protein
MSEPEPPRSGALVQRSVAEENAGYQPRMGQNDSDVTGTK